MTKEQLGSLILDSERQLYSTAKTILFSDYDCADAIQETIVKAFSNVGTLKNDNYARTWLIRILINECYSLVRKSSKFIPLENLADSLLENIQHFLHMCGKPVTISLTLEICKAHSMVRA